MKILVTGATGLIGSAVCARLAAEGHDITAVLRPGSRRAPPSAARTIHVDMAQATRPEDWGGSLAGIDAVVNCVGVLQDSNREDTRVHSSGAAALFQACERAGVRRVVHFSAIGVDRGAVSAFSETKSQGDAALVERDLDWVILRPSVVLGRAAFGASALIRGLAALPMVPLMPETGPLQVVALDDVVETVAFFISPSAPARLELEIAGPERLTMEKIVALYREWLGWAPARVRELPRAVSSLLYHLGDFAGMLGWRPPMRSTARQEIVRGAIGDPSAWTEITGIRPRSLAAVLASEPASVQERWFAKLYFLKPITFVVLPLFWLATGIISLTVGYGIGVDLMLAAGAGALAGPSVIAGAIADMCVGTAIAFRRWTRWGLYAAILLSLFYAVAGTVLLPELWNEPLGPLLKIWPILVLHMVALGILAER